MLDTARAAAIEGLVQAGVDFVSGLPDGWQRDLHEATSTSPASRSARVCRRWLGEIAAAEDPAALGAVLGAHHTIAST
jgi:hypothetical protein